VAAIALFLIGTSIVLPVRLSMTSQLAFTGSFNEIRARSKTRRGGCVYVIAFSGGQAS